jgi:protein dithiol oxidoreductase (disulfide-forming)
MHSQLILGSKLPGLRSAFPWLRTLAVMLFTFGFMAAIAPNMASAEGLPEVVRLNPPQATPDNGKVEVIEFFAYGCGHCAALEPRLVEWVKTLGPEVNFRRVPVSESGFSIRGVDSAPIYYTLEALGLLKTMHEKVFAALNNEGEVLANPKVLRAWLEKQGIDPSKYDAAAASFGVSSKVAQARKMTADYQLRSTPTITVGGRYALTQGSNPSPKLFFAKVEELVAQLNTAKKVVTTP